MNFWGVNDARYLPIYRLTAVSKLLSHRAKLCQPALLHHHLDQRRGRELLLEIAFLIFKGRDQTPWLLRNPTFNRHFVDPIKRADNHVTINILHDMAWLGGISQLGPHCLSCRQGFLRHAKLEIRSFHFLLSIARTHRSNNYPHGLLRVSNISRSFPFAIATSSDALSINRRRIIKFVCYRTARITW